MSPEGHCVVGELPGDPGSPDAKILVPRTGWGGGAGTGVGGCAPGEPLGLIYCNAKIRLQSGGEAEPSAKHAPILFCSTYFRYLLPPYVMLNIKKHVAEIPPERADISQYSSDAGDYGSR